jgi:RecA-family ATPase
VQQEVEQVSRPDEPKAVDDFIRYLASIADKAEYARLIESVKLRAAKVSEDEPFKAPIRTLRQYLDDDIEVPPVLIEPAMLVRGGVNTTVGRAGKGKTVMNLNRMLRWAAGSPQFPGWKDREGNDVMAPVDPLKILIVENEGAAGMFHRQVGIMTHASDYLSDAERKLALENVLIWREGGYSNLKLDDERKLKELRDGIEEWEPDIVYIEPFRTLWTGDENSSTDMQPVLDALANIAADYQCGVWISHHERKSGAGDGDEKMNAARGSGALEGIISVMENFESTKGGEQREITWSKSRYHPAPNPVRLEWDEQAWWYKWIPSSDIEEAILSALRMNDDEPMNVTTLAEDLEEKDSKIRKVIKKLESEGRVKRLPSVSDGRGSSGHRYLAATADDSETGTGGLSL